MLTIPNLPPRPSYGTTILAISTVSREEVFLGDRTRKKLAAIVAATVSLEVLELLRPEGHVTFALSLEGCDIGPDKVAGLHTVGHPSRSRATVPPK